MDGHGKTATRLTVDTNRVAATFPYVVTTASRCVGQSRKGRGPGRAPAVTLRVAEMRFSSRLCLAATNARRGESHGQVSPQPLTTMFEAEPFSATTTNSSALPSMSSLLDAAG